MVSGYAAAAPQDPEEQSTRVSPQPT
eukprot:SAG22_NODE_13799_length_394_cov_0.959322_1_plen_25_part_10